MTERRSNPPVPFLQSVNLVFGATVISYLLGFVGNVIVTRNLPAGERGEYALYIVSITIASSIFSLGYHQASVYFAGRERIELATIVGQAPLILVLCMVGSALIGVAAYFAPGVAIPLGWWMVALFVAGVALIVAGTFLGSVFLVFGRFGALNLLSLLRAGVFPIWISLWLLVGPLDLRLVIVFWLATQLFALVAGVVMIRDRSLTTQFGRIDWNLLRRMLRFGLTGQAGNIASMLNYRLDSYILLAYVSSAGVAYYAIATAVAEALWFLPTSLATVLLRRLTHDFSAQSTHTTAVATRTTLGITLIGAAGIAVISPWAIPTAFGQMYAAGVPALLFLLPGVVAGAVSKVLASYIFSAGRVSINTVVSLVSLVATVGLDLALIPRLGLVGAALASSGSYIISAFLMLWAFRSLTGASVRSALIPQAADLTEFIDRVRHLYRGFRPLRRSA